MPPVSRTAPPCAGSRRSWPVDGNPEMPKVRTTLTIDDDVIRAVKIRAARSGKGDSEVIEESLRRDLGLDSSSGCWRRTSCLKTRRWPWRWRRSTRTGHRGGADPCGWSSTSMSSCPRCSHRAARRRASWRPGRTEASTSSCRRSCSAELRRTLTYPKLKSRIGPESTERIIDWLARFAILVDDPATAPLVRSSDPHDDYLIALADKEEAVLVSGDAHLLSLRPGLPIHSPAEFLAVLTE